LRNKQLANLQCEALFAFCAVSQRLHLALRKNDAAFIPIKAKRNARITLGRFYQKNILRIFTLITR